MDYLRERGKRVLDNLDERRSEVLHRWEDKSREFIHSFLELFGSEGRVQQFWNEGRGKLLKALSPPGSPSGSMRRNGLDETSTEESCESEEDEEEYGLSKKRRIVSTFL